MYQRDDLTGGHIIKLGPGNEDAAMSALRAFPGGMQLGGGVTPENAKKYLEAGASHVIVTSYVFSGGRIDWVRLGDLVEAVGKERLVLDVSCRRRPTRKQRGSNPEAAGASEAGAETELVVVTDRWQKWTDEVVDAALLRRLGDHCAELLVHGVDVEGMQSGVDSGLVRLLGSSCSIPVTYAGGVRSLEDCEVVLREGGGRVDLTIGSALDVFGGKLPYDEVLVWFKEHGGRGEAGASASASTSASASASGGGGSHDAADGTKD